MSANDPQKGLKAPLSCNLIMTATESSPACSHAISQIDSSLLILPPSHISTTSTTAIGPLTNDTGNQPLRNATTAIEQGPYQQAKVKESSHIELDVSSTLFLSRIKATKPKVDLKKYAPVVHVPGFHEDKQVDISTPPPGTYYFPVIKQPEQRLKYRQRFTRPDVIPPPSTPLHLQIEACAYRWAVWAAKIKDPERRGEVIKWISRVLEKVYLQGMKQWSISDSNDDKPRGEHTQDIQHAFQSSAPQTGKSRRKRPVSPSREILLKSQSRKGAERYAITAGELEEAGVTIEKIQERVANQDLDEEDGLMAETLDEIEKVHIEVHDWYGVTSKTKYNIWGRHLLIYCLYEVQCSRKAIEKLESLFASFSQALQRKNTLARIQAERGRHNQFLALALELSGKVSSRSPTPGSVIIHSASSEGSQLPTSDLMEMQDSAPAQPQMVKSTTRRYQARESSSIIPECTPVDRTKYPAELRKKRCIEYSGDAQEVSAIKKQKIMIGKRMTPETGLDDMYDLLGEDDGLLLPTKEELLQAIPSEGLKPEQLSSIFVGRVDPSHPSWERLLLSVAAWDRNSGIWHRKDILPSSDLEVEPGEDKILHESILKLKMPTKDRFNPEDYSNKRVTNYKGFRFRYASQSTLAQRRSMDEALNIYVRQRIRPDRKRGIISGIPRYGCYEGLTSAENPFRTLVIHGFWDNKDKSSVKGAEWFYQGLEGPEAHESLTEQRQQELMENLLAEGNYQGHTSSAKKSVLDGILKNMLILRRSSSSSGFRLDGAGNSKMGKARTTASAPKRKRIMVTKAKQQAYDEDYDGSDGEWKP